MPKLKTKSSAKKRFKITASGKVLYNPAFCRHMQMNKPKSMKRKTRGSAVMFEGDARLVLRNWMPYARKKTGRPNPSPQARLAAAAAK